MFKFIDFKITSDCIIKDNNNKVYVYKLATAITKSDNIFSIDKDGPTGILTYNGNPINKILPIEVYDEVSIVNKIFVDNCNTFVNKLNNVGNVNDAITARVSNETINKQI